MDKERVAIVDDRASTALDGRPAARIPYAAPLLRRYGTIGELTRGQIEGQLEPGGLYPNFFASSGAA